jgi:K+-sensing histidine kinase KdpD
VKIRRIIIGLEPAPRSHATLEAAARLAAQMEAELVGLFVENINLLHFAALPFAREVGFASASRRALDVEGMERSLRGLAREARQTLAAVAGRVPVRWSFRVARGSAAGELLAAAADADLVIVNVEETDHLEQATTIRVVRAGDPDALRAAMEEGGGILVLAGADDTVVGDTLLKLIGQART